MKKMIFAICLTALFASCTNQSGQTDTTSDSTAATCKDTCVGTKIDSSKMKSVKSDSLKVDSVKAAKK